MERIIKCNKCGIKHSSDRMRYVQNTKNLMCLDCIEKIKKPQTVYPEKTETKDIKKRFRCKKCKHTFMLKEKFNKQCPFCGGYDLISQEWNSDLNTLIEDASNRIYDI
jgi:RNA polymerase subunit RPABC4/transcription elongation factor Spt4